MDNQVPYEILTGVGTLYVAPVGTAEPALGTTPGAAWKDMGYTQDGLTVKFGQKTEGITPDQETGQVKKVRTEESMSLDTSLLESTLENLGIFLGLPVTDTPPASGVIGSRKIGFYRGALVTNYAILFRGVSAYGDYPAQYFVPVGCFGGDVEAKYEKGKPPAWKVSLEAIVDPNATSNDEKFGHLTMQDAEALS